VLGNSNPLPSSISDLMIGPSVSWKVFALPRWSFPASENSKELSGR